MRELKISSLILSYTNGWPEQDVEFLRDLTFLQILNLTARRPISDGAVGSLINLESLNLNSYSSDRIDFSSMRSLRVCYLAWRTSAKTIFELTRLRRLGISGFKGKNLTAFSSFSNLEWLNFLISPVRSLEGLAGCVILRSLRLGMLTKLESLAGLEHNLELEELDINTCRKVSNLAPLSHLQSLRKLYVQNGRKIESLEPIGACRNLEDVTIEAHVRDGDLSALYELPRLRQLRIRMLPHYTGPPADTPIKFV